MQITFCITFCPVRRDGSLKLERQGESLVINGVAHDFATLPDGGEQPGEAFDADWFAGPVRRVGGRLEITLVLPHGAEAPQEVRFPAPLEVSDDGPVAVPGQGAGR